MWELLLLSGRLVENKGTNKMIQGSIPIPGNDLHLFVDTNLPCFIKIAMKRSSLLKTLLPWSSLTYSKRSSLFKDVILLPKLYRDWPQGPFSEHFIFFLTCVWANKLECYIALSRTGCLGSNTLAYWAHL